MAASHFKALTLVVLLALLPFLAEAQAPTSCTADSSAAHKTPATLTGAVTDPTGAAIIAATVVLTCNRPVQETHTAADGHYSLSVVPGTYQLKITAPNFQSETRTVRLSAKRKTLDITLALDRATSIVSVTAAPGFVADSSTTATKTDTPLIETPQSVSVITLDQLKQRNVQTLNQALAFSSGVGIETYGSETRFDWFNIRGFDESTYGLFRDNSRWQSGQVEGQIDPYELQEVDVIKGPSSVLYGQNTPGGLVNLVTKRPESSEANELILNLGNFNRRQVQGDFGGPLDTDAHWRYRLTGLYRDSDTQVNFVPDDRRLVAPALTWAPSGNTTLTILTDYQYDNTGWTQFLPAEGTLFASPFGRIPTSFFTGEPGFDFFHRQQWSAAYLFEHRFAHGWTVRQTSRFSKISFNGDTAFGGGLQADGRTLNRFGYSDELGLGLYTLDTQALSQFKTGPVQHSFLVGIDYSHAANTILNGSSLAPAIDVFAPQYGAAIPTPVLYSHTDQPSQQTGLYIQDHVELAHYLIATLSGREDWTDLTTRQLLGGTTSYQSPSAFTGRAGITYLSPLGLAPYFSYSTSFLPTTGVNFFGAPFLPTKGEQYEAGAKYQPKASDSFLTASFFNVTEHNVLTTDPSNPLNSLQTGAARSRGVELEGVASIFHGLDLHASYTHLDEVVTETTDITQLSKRPTLIPDQMAGLTLHYTVSRTRLAGLGVGFGVRYVGTTAGDPQNTLLLPGYSLFDASALYDWRRIRFQVNATNVGDKIYVPICTSASYCNYGYRRNVIGSVQYRWESWKGMF